MPTLTELKSTKVTAVDKARAVQDRMVAAGKKTMDDWDAPAIEEFNSLMKAVNEASTAYDTRFELQKSYDSLQSMQEQMNLPEGERPRKPIIQQDHNRIEWQNSRATPRVWQKGTAGTEEYNTYWNGYLRGNNQHTDKLAASVGMSSDNEERMGYFQTSEQFMSEVIKQVDDTVHVQRMSRVIMMPPARSLGVRVRRNRASTFQWAGENTDTTPTLDTSLSYGKRIMTPNYLQGSTVISRDLLRNVPSSESMVIEEIGVDLNYKLEPAFLLGDGNMKPLGLLTASNDGISTVRDFTSAATAHSFDDWTNLKYSLKPQYRGTASFMVHRYVLNQIALLKDGNGQYLWQPSRQAGQPDLILGSPVIESEWMPYAVTSGNYYAIFGNFNYYWIVYEMGMEMQRLNEMRARTNEYEYLFRCKLDAQPVQEEAFSRGKRA